MTLSRCLLILLAVWGLAAPAGARLDSQPSDKAKLQKELEQVEKQLADEREKLERTTMPALREAWAKVPKTLDATWTEALTKLAVQQSDAVQAARRDKKSEDKAVAKAFDALLSERIGPELGGWLAPVVVRFLLASEPNTAGAEDWAGIWEAVVAEKLDHADFDAAWSKVLASELFPRVRRAEERVAELKRELKRIEEAEAARAAGIPPGMARVPKKVHRIGIDEKECKDLTKALGYTNSPGRLLDLRRSAPAFQQEIDEFYIDRFEVTCNWYAEYLKDNPGAKPPMGWANKDAELGWSIPEKFENRPVTGISYYEAQEFASWMGRRLPTEFEWEAAARFSSDERELRYWPFGDTWPAKEVPANWAGQTRHPDRSGLKVGQPPLTQVGTFEQGASVLGLHDLAGNAWEWTSSPFKPYTGFKDIEIEKQRLTSFTFTGGFHTVRGGSASHDPYVVTTMWRKGESPTVRAEQIGFRTAASATRGKDMVAWTNRENRVQIHAVNSNPLPSDEQKGRRHAALGFDDPESYAILSTGGFDQERELPTRALHILTIRREVDGFRNLAELQAAAKDAPVMLGYLRLDHGAVKPALPAGEYMILWENGFVPPLPEGEKPAPGKKPEKVPDGLLFKAVNIATPREAVRFTEFVPPVVGAKQATRIVADAANNRIELVLAFPVSKFDKRQGFLVSIPIELETPGIAAKLR